MNVIIDYMGFLKDDTPIKLLHGSLQPPIVKFCM